MKGMERPWKASEGMLVHSPSTPFYKKLARQVAAYWTMSPYDQLFGNKEAAVVLEPFAELLWPHHAELLRSEGSYASKTIPGYEIPAGGATTMDVILVPTLMPACTASQVLWAPTPEECEAAGAIHHAESVLLLPSISAEVVAGARTELDGLGVRPDDTADSLRRKLSTSEVLDDAHVPLKSRGKGGRTERLNHSFMPQPRRISYSVRGSPVFWRGEAEVEMKLNYTAYMRVERDHVARRMTPGVYDFGLAVWLAARSRMDGVSAELPFTHVQVLWYYRSFKSRMGQHRDNNNVHDWRRFMDGLQDGCSRSGNCASHGQENSQEPGSWVAVMSMGTATMNCILRFPPIDNPYGSRQEYVAHPTFTVPLRPGTLFLFSPMDDLFFTHEAEFEAVLQDDIYSAEDDYGWREAWVWRHLGSLRCFHISVEKNRRFVDEEVLTAEKSRKVRRCKKAVADKKRRLWSTH